MLSQKTGNKFSVGGEGEAQGESAQPSSVIFCIRPILKLGIHIAFLENQKLANIKTQKKGIPWGSNQFHIVKVRIDFMIIECENGGLVIKRNKIMV